MTFETDSTKGLARGKSSGSLYGGWLWGWKKTNQAFFGTLSLMMLGIILVLSWETTGSGGFTALFFPRDPGKLIDVRFGDTVKVQALLASSAELDVALGRKLETDSSIWKVTDELKIDLDSSHDVAQGPEEASTRDVEPNDPSTIGKDRSPLPTPDPTTKEKSPETDVSNPSVVTKRSKKSAHSRNALIAGDEPSDTIESSKGSKLSKSEVCDFTKGYWVKDERRLFYSGKECKEYLSYGFACRLMTRPEFEYEKLRWQPEKCDLPSFTGEGFLKRLRNKVVAFVGDSLGREQFQSLMCMITQGKEDNSVKDVKRKWDTRWAYRFRETNTTILFYWSVTLSEIEEGHPKEEPGYSAMHLDRPASFLKRYFDKIDVLVLNTGHHWNQGKLQKNKWHRYLDGKPLVDPKLGGIANSLNLTVHNVVQWLDEKLADGKRNPAVFLRTLSPRHFKNGDWNSGGTCDSTRSHSRTDHVTVGKDKADKPSLSVYKGPVTEKVAEIAVRGTRVKLLNITYLSQFREEAHVSKYGFGKDSQHQDCLHWCLPGVPDVWNEILYANLLNDPSLSPMAHVQR